MTATVFVTGATGFIGSRVAGLLRARGDDVVAITRDPVGASALRDMGVRLVEGNLSSDGGIRDAMAGADAVIHIAGSYRIGIPVSARPAMYEANVTVTERVLDAAIAGKIPRIVHVSTINVFGDTHGRIPDESYRRDLDDGFLSYYDETKYAAHVRAETRIGAGAPIVIVQPGTVYGLGDHSGLGFQLKAAFEGTARYIAARAGGREAPRLRVPTAVLRAGSRLAPEAGGLFGLLPNIREIVRACDGVTYWGSNAKAVAELGFAPRGLAVGARDAFGSTGLP